uniref:ALMS motif domain-containing protein n=1 Tax=Oncorhynchus tshawytscha TaxID=74940 RepID=A0AAZ3Q9B8_ONCTS
MGSGADWVSGAWTTRTGQVSHLHVTLSPGPKGAEERSRRLLSFAPVRHSSAVSSSVDEDESLGYAPEPAPANKTGSQENRDPIWRQGQETADASVQITTATATSTFPQCFTPPQRLTGTGPSRQAALTVLLPYKPHGSEEMFYVPQTHPEPQLSPIRSDSTMESSHPGSDDAVPPRFNIEILGSRDQQVDQVVDRGVNIKHTEGIYSKRQRLGENYSMERTGTSVPDDEGQPLVDQRTPQSKFFSHVTGGLTRVPAIPITTTRGPAVPTTTTRGPAIPTTTTRGPAIPTTTTRGPAVPTTTTREPAIPTTTTRGPAIPTTTTRGPAIPTTTTRGPAIPTTTTRGPSAAMRDHGTSITTSTHTQGVPDTDHPVQPSFRCSLGVGEEELEVFQPLHVEMDYSSMDLHHHFPKTHHLHMDHQISNAHLVRTSAPHPGMEREPGRRDHSLAQRSGSTLDQLWHRFSERWSLEEARPTNEREASLLERLERLSRLIHSTGTSAPPEPTQQTDTTEQEGGGRRRERKSSRKEEERRRGGVEEGRSRREESSSGRSDPHAKANQAKASVPRQAWEQQDEEPRAAEGEDSSSPSHGPAHSFSPSHLPARSQYLCPAERERSGSVSGETSSSMSTIDTARLVRAFGAHRVRGLNTQGTSHRTSHRTSHSLSKLYSTILQQRQSKEQRRGRPRETPHIPPVPSESTGTDNSVIPADSASSTSTYTLPSHRGPSHSKKAVKHVSKGVQAGDLEIVSNGTRRHTRDVGTTFPSPGSARGARVLPSSHSGSKRGRAGYRSPPKTQRKRKMSQPSARPYYPQGVSWYIPAEDLRAEGRKENKPEQQPHQGPAWFEPYSRTTRPWREPLRQRQIQDRERLTDRLQTNQLEADRDRPSERQHTKHSIITPPGPEPTGNAPAALVRISLQEALELRRPEFVSRSRERVKRLVLQVEERKLQVVFSRERNELFNQPRRPGRLSQPAGTAVFQRAVPKKEMVLRSKQRSGQEQEAGSNNRGARRRRMYEQLPEVQRRREEEKRREEYRSYRLNAQLYNKRITNRVLGRQTPWQ